MDPNLLYYGDNLDVRMSDAGAPGPQEQPTLPSAEHNHVFAPRPVEPPTIADDPVIEEYRKHLWEALHAASRAAEATG